MIPDIVEIKRLCVSGQWNTKLENGKILLHDTVAGETVCIGNIDAEPVRHAKAVFKVRRKWDGSAEGITETVPYCSDCGKRIDDLSALWCAGCGAKMDAEV